MSIDVSGRSDTGEILRAVIDTDHDRVVSLRMDRGQAAMARGDFIDAEIELRAALDLAVQNDLHETARAAHELLATLYRRLGRFEEALAEQDALVRARADELEMYQLEAFQRLAVLAEFRDTDTGEHTVRVGDLSAEIACELGEDDAWCEGVRMAARLHDIGKVAMPDAILLKPGPLTPDEFEVMKTHTTIGARILSDSTSKLIQLGAVIALNHHERWDGSGYPAGLRGTAIPRCGRVVTVADVFDALISERVYKHAWSRADAIAYIVDGRGAQFEPEVVDAFLRILARR